MIAVVQYVEARGELKDATIHENLISWCKAHWSFLLQ